jgi:hypothetical protein
MNGKCDVSCNVEECGFDGGDCDVKILFNDTELTKFDNYTDIMEEFKDVEQPNSKPDTLPPPPELNETNRPKIDCICI